MSPYYRSIAWHHFDDDRLADLVEFNNRYLSFLNTAVTERLACDEILRRAAESGFKKFGAGSGKRLREYHTFDGRCGALVNIGDPAHIDDGLVIVATHIDSPRLDLKPNPLIHDSGFALLKTRYYGGVKKYQWVGIPLALHGYVVFEDGTSRSISIGNKEDDPVFTITDLLPHLGTDQMKKPASEFIPAEKLNVLFGSRAAFPGQDFESKELDGKVTDEISRALKKAYGITREDFASAEFEVVPALRAREVGLDRSMIGGYGQDNRLCTFAALEAILASDKPKANTAFVFFDREEIGSQGSHGADSNLIERIMLRVFEQLQRPDWFALKRSMANSIIISGDVNVGIDPNWKDVTEEANCAKIGSGVCVTKYTGSGGKRGASEADASVVARLRRVLNERKIPWQIGELGKVDAGGGGTVALHLARSGANVIDCGPPVLSMHSPFEIASKVDVYSTYLAYKGFFEELSGWSSQKL